MIVDCRYLFVQDKFAAKKGIVSMESTRARNRKNVVTLSGQALTGFIKIFIAAFTSFMVSATEVFGMEPAFYVILIPVMSSVVSMILFCTSPELKRHFLPSPDLP